MRLKFLCFIVLAFLLVACAIPEKKELHEESTEESEQDRIDLAIRQEFEMTQDPALGYVPRERLLAAQAYQNRLLARNARTDALLWQERGPNNVAGRIRAFFIDKQDASGNTVFAASVSGGIWKATNFKTSPTWTPVAENMGSLAVCALAQDPSNLSVMYAGTGEGWFNSDAIRGNGIWKSIDGGSTWNQLSTTDSIGGTFNFDFIQDIVVTSTGVVYAASRPSKFCNRGGVLRSTNGGASWQRVIGTFPSGGTSCTQAENFYAADLEIASNGDLYATTGFSGGSSANTQGKIFRSSAADNGTNVGASGTWTNITPAGTWERIELATAPSAPGTLYALFEQSDAIGSLQKSIDFGATWTAMAKPTWCNQGATSNDFTNEQAWYNLIAAVDPNNSNTVMIGGIDLFRSTNGGTSWVQVSQWAANCGTLPNVHADQHNIVFYPGSSTEILASNDGGIYYSGDGGTGWSSRNLGLNITQFYGCDYHPTNPDYFLGGAQDNGTQRFTSPGINSTNRVSGGDGGFPHIDQTDGQIQISAYVHNNFYWSRNGGNGVFTPVPGANDRGQFINPSDYNDVDNTLFSGDDAGKYFYVTGFASATPVNSVNTITAMGSREVTAVKVDPFSENTIWLGASKNDNVPMILKVSGANTSNPTVVVSSTIPAPTNAYLSSIDIDPANASHILVTFSNYGVTSIWESTNGGNSWVNIEGNFPDVPVRWAVFAGPTAQLNGPASGNGGILIATELGVWTTSQTNGTATQWIPNKSGLPNVRVDQLKYRNDGTVVAATHGRGLFTATITGGGTSTGIPTVSNTKDFIRYVSATRNLLIVTGNLTTRTMDVQVYDMKGRMVHRSTKSYQTTNIPLESLASGSYILRIYGNKKEQFTAQFIKQ